MALFPVLCGKKTDVPGTASAGGGSGRTAHHPCVDGIRGIPQPDRIGTVRALGARNAGGAPVRRVPPPLLYLLLLRRVSPARPVSPGRAGPAPLSSGRGDPSSVPRSPDRRGRASFLYPLGPEGVRGDHPMAAEQKRGTPGTGAERPPLHPQGGRHPPPPALSRHLRDPRLPPGPNPELPRIRRDGRPLFLCGDVLRGAPDGPQIRGGVPELPALLEERPRIEIK